MYMARMGQENRSSGSRHRASNYLLLPMGVDASRRKGHDICNALEDSAAIRRFLVSKLSCFSKNVWSFEIALQSTVVNRKIDRH
jgi:hypothetical protein